MKARYLIRFDDICDTSNWSVLSEIEAILVERGIRPVAAVIPDNRDPELAVHHPRPAFWETVRHWQSLGWSIGLHGYQHLLTQQNGGLLNVNPFGEFGDAPEDVQERKLKAALSIFGEYGVRPDVWVAPAHSFDDVTLRILRKHGLAALSDGYFPYPGHDKYGILWIPQQLWDFRPRPFGVWTVCYHPNGWKKADLVSFHRNVARYRTAIVSFEEIQQEFASRQRSLWDHLFATGYRKVYSLKKFLIPALRLK